MKAQNDESFLPGPVLVDSSRVDSQSGDARQDISSISADSDAFEDCRRLLNHSTMGPKSHNQTTQVGLSSSLHPTSTRKKVLQFSRKASSWVVIFAICLASNMTMMGAVEAFNPSTTISTRATLALAANIDRFTLSMVNNRDGGGDTNDNDSNNNKDDSSFDDFGENEVGSGGVKIDDLNWRVNKMRLEEANKKRFLKARPRFLPYVECAKWVQAFGGRWLSEEDWVDWIAMGEKRNSYIPSRPDEYYGRLGQWISWVSFGLLLFSSLFCAWL